MADFILGFAVATVSMSIGTFIAIVLCARLSDPFSDDIETERR